MNSNSKVTLTLGQLKKLVRESHVANEDTFGEDEGNYKLLQREIEKVIASKCKDWEENGARLPFGMERNLARAIVEHLYLEWDCKPIGGNVPNHENPRLDESTRGNKRGSKRVSRTKSRGKQP